MDRFASHLWFCSGKSSEVRSSSYDCSSSSILWSSLLLYALLGFLGTVNSSSSVIIGGSLSLVAQTIEHSRYFVLFPQASEPSWRIGLLHRDFDPSGSHHLPIAAGERWRPILADTLHLTIFRDYILGRRIDNV